MLMATDEVDTSAGQFTVEQEEDSFMSAFGSLPTG